MKKVSFKHALAGFLAVSMVGTGAVGAAGTYYVENPVYWEYDVVPAEKAVSYNLDRVTEDVALMLMGKQEFRPVSEIITGQKATTRGNGPRDTINEFGMMDNGYDDLRAEVPGDGEEKPEKETENTESAKKAYSTYITANYRDFEKGMFMCDLNEDGIPEVFSVTNPVDGIGNLVFHEYKNDAVAKASVAEQISVNVNSLASDSTFFLNHTSFVGVYRNNNTNKKALIISNIASENRTFDIITYDGNSLKIEHKINEIMADDGINANVNIDKIMADYELCDDFYSAVQLNGENDAKNTFEKFIADFKEDKCVEYGDVVNGEVKCYIRNINIDDNELELVPVSEISYDAYRDAVEGENIIALNGEAAKINFDEELYKNVGLMSIERECGIVHYFDVPEAAGESGVIIDYFGNAPFKTKMSDDFKFVYEMDNKEYTAKEYLPQYASLKMMNYCVAQIENGVVKSVKVLYHP